jgi:predicted Zn-dependent protease
VIEGGRRSRALPLVLCLAACATPGVSAVPDIGPGERPPIASDEAGLWMEMDRLEAELRSSGRVVADPELNGYVRGIVCRLSPEYCGSVRVYILAIPHFNAMMAPNGAMQVWTGLMLRASNEAQLAAVVAHELAHFQRRHSLQRWRDLRAKANFALVFSIITAGAGVGWAGIAGELAMIGSVLAFSRDQEREADRLSIELMTRAGYDPLQAAGLWQGLIEEHEAGDRSATVFFLSTHPGIDERIASLREQAGSVTARAGEIETGAAAFRRATAPFRDAWLRDELRRREFAESAVVLARLRERSPGDGLLDFYQGELLRLRAGAGDGERAIAAYRSALASGGAPPEAHRSLALVLLRAGRGAEARQSFEAYLDERPDASDRALILQQIEQLR